MSSIVESWAHQIEWNIGKSNVIVEGTSDASLLYHARNLWLANCTRDIFGDGFAVVAAGKREDGGVDGVNRRLNAVRQLAEVDVDAEGKQRYRFIGLLDNDRAGRRALRWACEFDRRVIRYQDLFLLHPNMPRANGDPGSEVEHRARSLNEKYCNLDWEIEDLLPESLHDEFQNQFPNAILSSQSQNGRTHREFTRDGKVQFRHFVLDRAQPEDIVELVSLACALRDYLGLPHEHLRP